MAAKAEVCRNHLQGGGSPVLGIKTSKTLPDNIAAEYCRAKFNILYILYRYVLAYFYFPKATVLPEKAAEELRHTKPATFCIQRQPPSAKTQPKPSQTTVPGPKSSQSLPQSSTTSWCSPTSLQKHHPRCVLMEVQHLIDFRTLRCSAQCMGVGFGP